MTDATYVQPHGPMPSQEGHSAIAEREALIQGLKRYADHTPGCSWLQLPAGDRHCDCGVLALLAGLP